MWTPRISERGLFALSLISISLLLLASDLAPPLAADFEALTGQEGEVAILCAVTAMRKTETGWFLELIDASSNTMSGFCRIEAMTHPIQVGTPVRITGRVVTDPEPFLFVEEIIPLVDREKV